MHKGTEIEALWKFMTKMLKERMRKWTYKTRDGPGDPENYSEFESRDLENFFGPALTFMLMRDKSQGHPISCEF